MNNVSHITEKIINDARAQTEHRIAEAKKTASERLLDAKKQLEHHEAETIANMKTALEAQSAYQGQIDNLNSRKQTLADRQKIMDECFAQAQKELAKKSTFIQKVIKENTKTGDKVKKIEGGAIISNQNYEIHITADELLARARPQIESELIKLLFSEA